MAPSQKTNSLYGCSVKIYEVLYFVTRIHDAEKKHCLSDDSGIFQIQIFRKIFHAQLWDMANFILLQKIHLRGPKLDHWSVAEGDCE
jgi:hypothetical protein